jgi:cell division septum initiation protein DivIVA
MLTRQGIEKKTYMARQFLRWKMDEYDQLQREIDQLRQELGEEALREDSIGVAYDEAGSK